MKHLNFDGLFWLTKIDGERLPVIQRCMVFKKSGEASLCYISLADDMS